jgi:hypothetical protein
MFVIKQSLFLLLLISICSISLAGGLPAEKGELGDESWYVEERMGAVHFYTHGTAVYGHEFGFRLHPNNIDYDVLWITFSSFEKAVKKFVGNTISIFLIVDGVPYKAEVELLGAYSLKDLSGDPSLGDSFHIMCFTKWVAHDNFIDILNKGEYLEVQIFHPKEFQELCDIPRDKFGLEGFAKAREKAKLMCSERSNLRSELEVQNKNKGNM